MIWVYLFNFLSVLFGSVFKNLEVVTKLPDIFGYDIDTPFASGVSMLYAIFYTFWPLQDMFYGFLALCAYYGLKAGLKFILGSRTPY